MEQDTLILSNDEKELVIKLTPKNDYHIGQIFEGGYLPSAAIWCNQNNAYIEEIGERQYEIKAIPEPTPPTNEEISKMRESAYKEEIDGLHARKQRKEILGEWTEEDEAEYIAKVKELSAEIAERYPYNEEVA